MTLADFLAGLSAARVPCDYRDVRDVLWLAQYATPTPAKGGQEQPHAVPDPSVDPRQRRRASVEEEQRDASRDYLRVAVPSTVPQGELYAPLRGASRARARIQRVPGVAALADALDIARALRPFSRRRRSATVTTFDEEATVERTAETHVLSVVMRPVFERWFELVLLVEHSESMVVWRRTVTELQQLFERNGCFRAVTRWSIRDKGGNMALVSPAGTTHAPDEIRARVAHRLVVLVSDAASAGWHDGRMARLLAPLAQRMPVAVLQLLPVHAWRNTALGAADWTFWSTLPGTANRDLLMNAPWWSEAPENAVRLPVVALNPEAVLSWARTVMASGGARVNGVEVQVDGADDSAAPGDVLDARTRVEHFRAAASPVAFRLATLLAAATPLTAPTMRLVQQAMLPGSRPDVLAEVFLGDLLQRETAAEDNVDEDEIAYAFRDDVREVLQESLPGSAAEDVLGRVAAYLSDRYGQTINFRALHADPKGAERLPEGARPFARLASEVMRRQSAIAVDAGSEAVEYRYEQKFGEGLTIATAHDLPGEVSQIEWSRDGAWLGARHALGVTAFPSHGERDTLEYRPAARTGYVLFAYDVEREIARGFAQRLRLAVERQWRVPWHFTALGADDADAGATSPEHWIQSLGGADAVVVLLTPDYFFSRFSHAQAAVLGRTDRAVDTKTMVLMLSPMEQHGFESVPHTFTVTPSPLEKWYESGEWHDLPRPLIELLLLHFNDIPPPEYAARLLAFNWSGHTGAMIALEQDTSGFALRRVLGEEAELVFNFEYPNPGIRAAALALNGDTALIDVDGRLTRQMRTIDGWQSKLFELSDVIAAEWPFGQGNMLAARTTSGVTLLEALGDGKHAASA
jgi:hypothetical protein